MYSCYQDNVSNYQIMILKAAATTNHLLTCWLLPNMPVEVLYVEEGLKQILFFVKEGLQ